MSKMLFQLYCPFQLETNQEGLLISWSSAAIEFSRSNYMARAKLYPDDPIKIDIEPPKKGIHSNLRFEDSKNSFLFVNFRFPINFTGERECLPLKFIHQGFKDGKYIDNTYNILS